MTDTKLAPKTEAKSKPSVRRADIQGIRAVAVFLVVAFHAGLPIPGGYVGVDVFFVISGFVITAMLFREKLLTGRISLKTFYVRRFLRLTPALAVMVAVTVIIVALPFNSIPGQQTTATTAKGAMLLVANFAIARSTGGYFDFGATINPLLHTWSLSVEEQFYVVFPILLIAAWAVGRRLGRPRLAVAVAVSGLAIVTLAVALISAAGIPTPLIPGDLLGFYSPLGRAWEFAAGALLSIAGSRLRSPSRRLAFVLGLAGVALLVFAAIAFNESTVFPGAATLIPVVATMLLLYVGLTPSNPMSALLGSRPMVKLGDLSYSWYLWHWPAIVFASLLWPGNPVVPFLAALLSLIPAVASYRFVEQRYRRSYPGSRIRFSAFVAVVLIVPLALSTMLTYVVSNSYWSPRIAQVQSQQLHASLEAGCMSYTSITEATQDNCTWNA